jgi:hypothetical protein
MDTQDHGFDGAILGGFVELSPHPRHRAFFLSQSQPRGLRNLTQYPLDVDQCDLRPALPLDDGFPQAAGLATEDVNGDASGAGEGKEDEARPSCQAGAAKQS